VIRVYTSGVFDLFHVGHLTILKKSAKLGDYLIVGVATDEDVLEYKNPAHIPYKQRREIVASIDCVDEVIIAPNYTDKAFYSIHDIDIHCQGSEVAGYDFYKVPRGMGILRVVGRDTRIDTTQIINDITQKNKDLCLPKYSSVN